MTYRERKYRQYLTKEKEYCPNGDVDEEGRDNEPAHAPGVPEANVAGPRQDVSLNLEGTEYDYMHIMHFPCFRYTYISSFSVLTNDFRTVFPYEDVKQSSKTHVQFGLQSFKKRFMTHILYLDI